MVHGPSLARLTRPRSEKDITQVSGTCSPRSIRGRGILSAAITCLDFAKLFRYSPRLRVGVVSLRPLLHKEVEMDFPKCQKCNNGILIPLSDYGQEGASVLFKAWVCINPDCGFSLRVDKGEVSYGKKIEHKH